MANGARYKVQTRYGWFSLDESSYRDYLSGKLQWIDWPPLRTESTAAVHAALPPEVSKEAVKLRDKAEKQGILCVLQQFKATPPSPYKVRMSDTHVFELNLSVRASNGLMRADINTFEKLDSLIKSAGIGAIRNLGVKSAKEIQDTFFVDCYCKLLPYEKAEYWQSVLDANKEGIQ